MSDFLLYWPGACRVTSQARESYLALLFAAAAVLFVTRQETCPRQLPASAVTRFRDMCLILAIPDDIFRLQ